MQLQSRPARQTRLAQNGSSGTAKAPQQNQTRNPTNLMAKCASSQWNQGVGGDGGNHIIETRRNTIALARIIVIMAVSTLSFSPASGHLGTRPCILPRRLKYPEQPVGSSVAQFSC